MAFAVDLWSDCVHEQRFSCLCFVFDLIRFWLLIWLALAVIILPNPEAACGCPWAMRLRARQLQKTKGVATWAAPAAAAEGSRRQAVVENPNY